MLRTSAAVAQPRRAVGTASVHVAEPLHRVRVGRADDRDAGLDGEPHLLVPQVEPVGEPVHLERDAGLERDLDRPLEVERVRRPVAEDPPARMAEAADGRDGASPRSRARSARRAARAGRRGARAAPSRARRARRRAGRACRRRGCRTRSPRRTRNGASCSFAAAISSACRRSASASSPGTTRTFGVWSQIARYS